ncbi:tetratricopeptide repeat protein [Streptomyces sp. A7024]|uniref:Tetratricopeptide repeat protein n=1 Tax=Streptomyces coryli TaxID=1128680 RepID=A0A6G4TU63_9ACTN|nr:tetratricopeptide repeat protein [Streptomyces coryli]
MSDAIRLGVHPARSDQGDQASPNGGRLPAYVPREIDDALRTAVAHEVFVLIVGESTAGKSRSAFEAMRAVLPSHRLAVPVDRSAVIPLVEYVSRLTEPAVLWLDDLECFLGLDGLSPQLLSELTARPEVIRVATIRSSQYQRFTARREPAGDEQERTAWRASRDVLQRAHICSLDRIWSPQELEAASSFAEDPRIARALRHTHAFGLAEMLAAGPELLEDWQAAWEAGTHPRAAALVAAAVDCRRIGLDEPASRELLEELHHHYLAARGGHALRPESLEEAWHWALQPVHGASSLLLPSGTGAHSARFIAFDYLVDQPHQATIPAETWDIVFQHASTNQIPRIAGKAQWHQRRAFHQAFDAGLLESVFLRASALADRHRYAEAIALLSRELERQGDDAGGDPLEYNRSLRHNIAFYTMLMGQPGDAEAAFRALLAEYEALLPAGDEGLHVIRHNLASCARRRGDLADALDQFRALLADREVHLGPTAMNTLDTRRVIACIVAAMGDLDEAVRQAREVLELEEAHLGPDHINTLETRCCIADFLARTGDHTAALEALDACLPDLVRTNGREHPVVLDAKWQRATSLWENGQRAEAQGEFAQVLAIRDRRYGPDDPTTRQARTELTLLRSRQQP